MALTADILAELPAGAGAGCCSVAALDTAAHAAMAEPEPAADFGAYVATAADGSRSLQLLVEGMHCAGCIRRIESALSALPDVLAARANLTAHRLAVSWTGGVERAGVLAAVVQGLGYRVAPYDPATARTVEAQEQRALLRAVAVAGFAAGNIMLLSVSIWAGHFQDMGPATRDLLHWFSALVALPTVAYAGRPFFRSAVGALRARRTNMDVPISIGVLLATAMSLFETIGGGEHAYFDSAVMLLFFLLVGRYLDRLARGRARSVAERLLALRGTAVAVVGADGALAYRRPERVAPGMTILVAAGERLAVDGRVIEGRSDVDASLITGESLPVAVAPGDMLYAGTVNHAAPLKLVATAVGERTLLGEISRLMDAAEQGRARYVALADRISRLYAPLVHALALATFLGWLLLSAVGWQAALLTAVAVLIITCPCALGLAVPAVQVIASGRLLRRGVLLKSATALERLAAVDTVVFDKTGTLTRASLALLPDPARDAGALPLAASLAARSRHPVARALTRAAPAVAPAEGVREVPGQGLALASPQGEIRLGSRAFCGIGDDGGTDGPELWLVRPGAAPARFAFADALRPDAAEVVGALKAQGYRVELLSGDRAPVVDAVAAAAGIERWQAGCTPAQKVRRLEDLAAEGRRVLMVGDGLNDAPALAAALVSLSPATAADISQTAADAIFQGDSLAPVLASLAAARRADALVRQNFLLALGYNLLMVPLAIAGFVTPLLAAAAMSASSLLVIGNALRLGRAKLP